ncbi:MAG: sodium-translocating pyrophosphatase [Candidatus Omnitrophica bacterium]|nr:sodium-translocating pyrophosphatase [Candidatus Omnitrophota bacterium]
MHDYFFLVPVSALMALAFAFYLAFKVLNEPEGTPRMRSIAQAVRIGANAYLSRQYSGVFLFFLAVFIVLLLLAFLKYIVIFVPFAFLTGGMFSACAGFCGMTMATQASSRTAHACRHSLDRGLRIAFSSGAVMGLVVVGLGLLDLSIWYLSLNWYYSSHPTPQGMDKISAVTNTLLCFGMGASFQALFARVGGGIFTKAADVGADLVGKVEAGIPEDDDRNPAVIADNVGDNVGDVAGMGADLYESYVSAIVAAIALGVSAGLGVGGMLLPMFLAAVGIAASIIGTFFVHTPEKASQSQLLTALRKGVLAATGLMILACFWIVPQLLGEHSLGIAWSVVMGLVAGILIGLSTEYYTSSGYAPTRRLAQASLTGPATLIISGISIGMMSTALPILIVGGTIMASFVLSGGLQSFDLGLYGIGIAAVGMLSTLGITLATDAYGPVADNAGGNAQMAGLDPEIRIKTDALDSLGNTTAATGKGFAIGSAALTAIALISAYKDSVILHGGTIEMNLMQPVVICGLFIGTMMPYLFSALTMEAVSRAAAKVVVEVRRQFAEIPGIMERKAKPDYGRCVSIVTAAAQHEMKLPAILAILTPIVIGLLLGVNAVAGLLIGSTASGFVLAVMMANAGGAWDNAKKYIEEGNYGGKGSGSHKAGVIGDTVGDPFKDTAGPSINILIKLMSMVSIVFVSVILQHALFR